MGRVCPFLLAHFYPGLPRQDFHRQSQHNPQYFFGCLVSFLQAVNGLYETMVFTAALPVYAEPTLDKIEQEFGGGVPFQHRLFREHTVSYGGYPYVKDLRLLGRDMSRYEY